MGERGGEMNNVIIHAPDGNEFNADAYEYKAAIKQFIFRSPKRNNNWGVQQISLSADLTKRSRFQQYNNGSGFLIYDFQNCTLGISC